MLKKLITTLPLIIASLTFMPTSYADHHGMKKDTIFVIPFIITCLSH